MTNEIQLISEIGSSAVQTMIEEYSRWYFVQSVFTTVTASIALIVSILIFCSKLMKELDEAERFFAGGILLITSLLFLGYDIPTVFYPDAYAIHRVVTDLRGN